MWVKICANTNLADARLAADLGADALGFIFAPSRRRVTPAEVAGITPLLPDGIERIGVFTAGTAEEIAAAATHAGLTGVQLHGEFADSFFASFAAIAGERFAVIRTLHWSAGARAADTANTATASHLRHIAETAPETRVLLDSRVDDAATGGTGVSFSWEEAAAGLASVRGQQRLIVAGGLRPGNVGEAVRALSPYGVDVASGVEAAPGKKDPERLQMFLRNARAGDR